MTGVQTCALPIFALAKVIARERQALKTSKALFERAAKPVAEFDAIIAAKDAELAPAARKLLEMWPKTRELYARDEYVVKIRGKELRTRLIHETLSGSHVRKVALPRFEDEGEVLRFLMREKIGRASCRERVLDHV